MDELVQNTRKRINDVLGHIEHQTGLPFIRPDSNTWIIYLKSRPVHIMLNGPWITVTSKLMDDVQGGKEGQFYKELLELNARMNGLKIGIERGVITFNSEHQATDITFESIIDHLILHYSGYKQHFARVVKLAQSLGLKWGGSDNN